MGAVFDLPEPQAKVLLDAYNECKIRKGITFSIDQVTELPDIIEQGYRYNNNRDSN